MSRTREAAENEVGHPLLDLAGPTWQCGCSFDDDTENECSCEGNPVLATCSHYCAVHDIHHCPFCFTEHHEHFALEATEPGDLFDDEWWRDYGALDASDFNDSTEYLDYLYLCGIYPEWRRGKDY